MSKYKYISFFSGALGLDLGLEESGMECLAVNEIEPIFCDSEEAEEYANFIHELWEKGLKYFETLREEAKTMNRIAVKRLQVTAEALKKVAMELPEFKEVEKQ